MNNIYKFKSVSKNYGKNKKGIKNVNITIEKNKTTIFIGRNGAGKTTTIKLTLGLLYATEGKIIYSDDAYSIASGNKKIGFLPEIMYLPEQLTIKEFLINICRMRGLPKKEALTDIEYYSKKLGIYESLNRQICKLSKGMRQKVGIIQAFIHNPEVLILDEPTSGLDPESRKQLFDLIKDGKNNNKTFVISTHSLDEIEEIADKAIFFHNGDILQEINIEEIKNKRERMYIRTKNKIDIKNIALCLNYIEIYDDKCVILKSEYIDKLNDVLLELIKLNAMIDSVVPQVSGLQDYYLNLVTEADSV